MSQPSPPAPSSPSGSGFWKRGNARRVEGRFAESADWDTLSCQLCPHLCSIAPSRSGTCGVRSNRDGKLIVDTYGRVAVQNVVEAFELPLYHFHPADRWLQVGLRGCNMRCPFCNTAQYSQLAGAQTAYRSPEELVADAEKLGAQGVSFGVNEPLVSHEYVIDVFRAARARGLRTHLATAGSWCEDPFKEITDTTDAITFGFKGFDAYFLNSECGGHLDFTTQNIHAALSRGVHVETSYLIIETHKTWREQAQAFASWMSNLHAPLPVVLLALERAFHWKGDPTTREGILEARDLLIRHVSNLYVHDKALTYMDTTCHQCGRVLIRRGDAGTIVTPKAETNCPHCKAAVPYKG